MYEKIDDIISNLSLKYRISKTLTTSSIDHVYKEIRNKMGDDDFPNVLIHNWGRFKPNTRYFVYKIKNLYTYIKENEIVREDHYIRLNKYLNAYKRLCKEEKINFSDDFVEIENFLKKRNEESN